MLICAMGKKKKLARQEYCSFAGRFSSHLKQAVLGTEMCLRAEHVYPGHKKRPSLQSVMLKCIVCLFHKVAVCTALVWCTGGRVYLR